MMVFEMRAREPRHKPIKRTDALFDEVMLSIKYDPLPR